jgi:hypothetical protein
MDDHVRPVERDQAARGNRVVEIVHRQIPGQDFADGGLV